ncbi:hypothetical protein MCEMSEM47_01251 [Burkholderiales bacterium]
MIVTPSLVQAREPVPFDLDTWPHLSHSAGKAAVVFTSTHCVHCPGLVADLLGARKQLPQRYKILVVMTDGGASDLGKPPYNEADGRYFFKGNSQALRYSVNQSWKGVTPYVALMSPAGGVQFYSGSPPQDSLQRWLRDSR